ncbi:protein upstream of flc [Phtheirospermum japonicum]|uniref:Protein upstream of flc n=1 Tax=Phtheirospermum japonicum TaxID=374723 RepID=A0A830CP45_9LAMI|nr:protein upstream of flc [Phtheirospermum japonicum]
MSPDSSSNNKMCVQTRVNNIRPMTTFKKVDVVYYLSRNNGHLEHPHYIQVTHLAHQQLRLKDVMDRLTALRGKGMPSLYSWSCKRSYKNGYVWNDLSQTDVIYPSEGGEYVLKGSELLVGCTEKLYHLQLDNAQQQLQTQPKRNLLATKRQTDHQEMLKKQLYHPGQEEEDDDEYEVKTRYNICSKGVSTDEIEELKTQNPPKHTPTELNTYTTSFSPPSTTSSTHSDILSNTATTIANNPNENNNNNDSTTTHKRFEDGDPVGNEPMLNRNSMLFSLIACGGSGSFRKTDAPARKSCAGGNGLHKGVVCKAAAEDDDEMIKYMSENPRMFGNLQSEEKEYFSGSIVEAIANEERFGADQFGPALNKSSSFNHERSIKAGLGEAAEKEVKKEKGVKGKCIPRKKSSSKK